MKSLTLLLIPLVLLSSCTGVMTPKPDAKEIQYKEQLCKSQGGIYDPQYMECANISEKACSTIGGVYEACGSPCRHMKNVDACIDMCAEYCKL